MLASVLLLLCAAQNAVSDSYYDKSWDEYYDFSPSGRWIVSEEEVAHSPELSTTDPNVALSGTTSQSSTYDKFGASANAIDGSLITNYLKNTCSHTDLDIEPWWMVDLGRVYQISFVVILNRGDCCSDRLNGTEVRVGNSDKDGGTRNHRCAKIPSLGLGETVNLNCTGMKGRYVTVTIPDHVGYLTLCEVRVHGVPAPDNATDIDEPVEESGEKETSSIVEEAKKLLKHSNAAPNVALAGQSYQSSTLGMATPDQANDGSLTNTNETGKCAHTQHEMEPWWTVDLMSSYKVFSVAVTVPADCSTEELAGAQIRVGNSASGRGKNPSCGSIISVARGDTLSFDCGEMIGRYVTVFIPGREAVLVLCEVQVFGVPENTPSGDGNRNLSPEKMPHGASNLALRGKASQSSNYKFYDESYKAIDGSLYSRYPGGFCSHTNLESEPWLMVKLQAPAKVQSVAITNRGDCCRERINGAQIHIGNSEKDGGRDNPRCGTIFKMGYGETISFNCNGMEGQYVSIQITGRKEYLTVCEMQIFGVLTSSPKAIEPMPTPAELAISPDMTPETTRMPDTTPGTTQMPGLTGKSLVFPEATSNSYVILTPETSKKLRAFTLCMRISMPPQPKGRETILFSYRTLYYDALNLWLEKNGRLGFYMSGDGVYFQIPKMGPKWTHLCLAWDSLLGRVQAFVNGVPTRPRRYRSGHSVNTGGVFMLGQDPDSFLGDFDADQSFVGEIKDLYMWNRKLHKGMIRRVFQGEHIPESKVFDWRSLSYKTQGNVQIKESEKSD
ncbi:pentraxin fusion protein-like isoform X2 [Lissotriton helveticus]